MLDFLEQAVEGLHQRLGEVTIENYRWFLLGGLLVGLVFGSFGTWGVVAHRGDPAVLIEFCVWFSVAFFLSGFGALWFETNCGRAALSSFGLSFGFSVGLCIPILIGWASAGNEPDEWPAIVFVLSALVIWLLFDREDTHFDQMKASILPFLIL